MTGIDGCASVKAIPKAVRLSKSLSDGSVLEIVIDAECRLVDPYPTARPSLTFSTLKKLPKSAIEDSREDGNATELLRWPEAPQSEKNPSRSLPPSGVPCQTEEQPRIGN